ncbi:metal-dependent hydrolase [Helicobacter sp. 23-1045]
MAIYKFTIFRRFKGDILLAKSHISLGLIGGVCAYPLAQKCGIAKEFYLTLLLPLILLGSLLPDIDEPKSFIGRKFPLISRIFSISFSHRGFTHFLIFPLIFVVVGAVLAHEIITPCFFALSYGIFLHQIGDMMTISGIPHYFFPISRKKAVLLPQFLRFRTGSIAEKIILICILTPLIALSSVFVFGDSPDISQIQNLQNLKAIKRFLKHIGDFAL